MAREIFVDISGFYAILTKRDDRHGAAVACLEKAGRDGRRFVTTDYVLDETATLLKARGQTHLLDGFFAFVLKSQVCRIVWTDAARFETTRHFFLKHQDQDWSFTNCVGFIVMKELKLRDALTKDKHFHAAGFLALLE